MIARDDQLAVRYSTNSSATASAPMNSDEILTPVALSGHPVCSARACASGMGTSLPSMKTCCTSDDGAVSALSTSPAEGASISTADADSVRSGAATRVGSGTRCAGSATPSGSGRAKGAVAAARGASAGRRGANAAATGAVAVFGALGSA